MRKFRSAVLAGVAALAAVGTAVAASHDTHMMKIALPDGSIARIEYHGDVAPKVVVGPAAPATLPVAFFDPFTLSGFDMAPFTELEQAAARMDREMEAMIRQTAALSAQPPAPDGKIDMAAFGKMPAGVVHYSFVSTSSGNGACSRSVQVTSYGAGAQPKVVQTSSGDCKGMPEVTPAATAVQPPIRPQPVKAEAKAAAPVPSTI